MKEVCIDSGKEKINKKEMREQKIASIYVVRSPVPAIVDVGT